MTTNATRYIGSLQQVVQTAEGARIVISGAQTALGHISTLSDAIGDFYNDADDLAKFASNMKTATSVLSKFGPFGKVVSVLDKIVGKVEDRIEDLRDQAKKADNAWHTAAKVADGMEKALNGLDLVAVNTIQDIVSSLGSLQDVEAMLRMDRESLTVEQAAAIGKIEALIDALSPEDISAVDQALANIATQVGRIDSQLGLVESMSKAMTSAISKIGQITDKLEPLEEPFDLIGKALKPFEWVLDKADKVIAFIIDPVLEPILEEFGVNDLIDDAVAKIEALLPSANLFKAPAKLLPTLLKVMDPDTITDLREGVESAVTGRLLGDTGALGTLLKDGDAGANLIIGVNDLLSQVSTLTGGAGDDMLSGGAGRDTLKGEAGNDIMVDGAGSDTYDGGDGLDTVMFAGGVTDFDFATKGGTTVLTQRETGDRDTITETEMFVFDDAVIRAEEVSLVQTINYAKGQQRLTGSEAENILFGGQKADTLTGKGGDDRLMGGDNDDLLMAGSGDDESHGGTGNDRIIDNAGTDTLFGGDGNDAMSALSGANTLHGEAHDDLLVGGIGGDRLDGGEGRDVLIGDVSARFGGNDQLSGGAGDDLLSGGAGADQFHFTTDGGTDTIGTIDLAPAAPFKSKVTGPDFQSGLDQIVLDGFGYGSVEEAFSHVTEQSGTAAFIDQGTTILFTGLTAADLNANDFILA